MRSTSGRMRGVHSTLAASVTAASRWFRSEASQPQRCKAAKDVDDGQSENRKAKAERWHDQKRTRKNSGDCAQGICRIDRTDAAAVCLQRSNEPFHGR